MKLSRELRGLFDKIEALVTDELGERHTLALLIQPEDKSKPGEPAEFQYISNAPRATFMQPALEALLSNWKAGTPDVPPHAKQ